MWEIAFTIWLLVMGTVMMLPVILDIYKICKGDGQKNER